MRKKSILYLIGITLVTLSTGCTSEVEEPTISEELGITEVDMNLSFGTDWAIDLEDTRAVPPGTGGNNDTDIKIDGDEDMTEVDRVHVIAFKRREETSGSFIYDILNDQILPIKEEPVKGEDGDPTNHKHLIAKGKFKKVYGFEYRVIAIAYASEKNSLYKDIDIYDKSNFLRPNGEHNWFILNTDADPTYEEVMASLNFETIPNNVSETSWRDFMKCNGPTYSLTDISSYEKNVNSLSRNVIQTPQLFYGILHSESGSEIIGYSETDGEGDLVKDLPLSGILYRGVAKLVIRLKLKKTDKSSELRPFNTYKWIALLADEVATDVNLSSYDDFLMPSKKKEISSGYTAVNYLDLTGGYSDGEYRTIETWFLPTRTRLALRIKGDFSSPTTNNIKNYQIVTTGPIYSTGNGTGIISPDVVDGVFYLRRNHKYSIIEIDVDQLMNSKHELK